MRDDRHDHDRGLAFDLETLVQRRRALKLFAGAGAGVLLTACARATNSGSPATTTATTAAGSGTSTGTATGSCTVIPQETAGPYPGDGSNGPNVLTQSGIVRSDIRSSFGSSTTTAAGVPLTIRLKVLDTANGCATLVNAAVRLWHCDINGAYSMYSQAVKNENYLRGVQAAGSDGTLSFTSIFPAAYSGRWPHIHFEVYETLAAATAGRNAIATSQIALPEDVCTTVYATSGYSQSVRNMAQTSLARDNVFSDGWQTQLGTMSGTVASGLTVALDVPVG